MILCIKYPNGHTRALLKLINTCIQMVGYNSMKMISLPQYQRYTEKETNKQSQSQKSRKQNILEST